MHVADKIAVEIEIMNSFVVFMVFSCVDAVFTIDRSNEISDFSVA